MKSVDLLYEALLPLIKAGAVSTGFYALISSVFQILMCKTCREVYCILCIIVASIFFVIVCANYGIKIPIAVCFTSMLCAGAVQQVCNKRGQTNHVKGGGHYVY